MACFLYFSIYVLTKQTMENSHHVATISQTPQERKCLLTLMGVLFVSSPLLSRRPGYYGNPTIREKGRCNSEVLIISPLIPRLCTWVSLSLHYTQES